MQRGEDVLEEAHGDEKEAGRHSELYRMSVVGVVGKSGRADLAMMVLVHVLVERTPVKQAMVYVVARIVDKEEEYKRKR